MSALLAILKTVTLEPVMLIDGAGSEAMLLFLENVQLNKICSVNLGFSSEVCENLSDHPEQNVQVQKEFSVFSFYNSIISSVLALSFVLFMGSWSDKYGRKIPLLITLFCHVLYAGGYLLNNWQTTWPVEIIYAVTLLDALGGGNMGLLSNSVSYISDISPEKSRTTRVSTATSMWYLGGPLGTLVGALLIKYVNYNVALSVVLVAYLSAALYVIFFIKESHGPYTYKSFQNKDSQKDQGSSEPKQEQVSAFCMIKDFFNWRRVFETIKTAFMKREGNARAVLLAIIFTSMLRRAGRGFFMYMFVRQALEWEAADYGYWVTYRNLLAALGSLFFVPLLTKLLSFTDSALVVLGSVSIIGEYVCYGLVRNVSQSFLMWLGPPAGLISNASVIAFRSLATKLVNSSEKGRVNAIITAMNGLMPMVAYAAYSPIYYKTVDTFPAAQFFFGASLNAIILVIFTCIQCLNRSSSTSDEKDVESCENKSSNNVLKLFEKTTALSLKTLICKISGYQEQKNSTKTTGQTVSISSVLRKIQESSEESNIAISNTEKVFGVSKCHNESDIAHPSIFRRIDSNPQISISCSSITQTQLEIEFEDPENNVRTQEEDSDSENKFHEIPLDNEPVKDMTHSA